MAQPTFYIFASGSWPTFLGEIGGNNTDHAVEVYKQNIKHNGGPLYAIRKGALMTREESAAVQKVLSQKASG